MTALILAGGLSTRMGRDKALIAYHGQQPQIVHLAELLGGYCQRVIVSGYKRPYYVHQLTFLPDDPQYTNCGPMAGVLTAFDAHPTALLVVGCDYPAFGAEHVEILLQHRNNSAVATCFRAEKQYLEPLMCIYETHGLALLRESYAAGNRSMRRFLEQNGAHCIDLDNVPASVDK